MTDKEKIVNPFDKIKPKVANPPPKQNINKKVQQQNMNNFRDQLNQQLFGEINDNPKSASELFGGIEDTPKGEVTETKNPLKVFKKSEVIKESAEPHDYNRFGIDESEVFTNKNLNEEKSPKEHINFPEENCNSILFSEKTVKQEKIGVNLEKSEDILPKPAVSAIIPFGSTNESAIEKNKTVEHVEPYNSSNSIDKLKVENNELRQLNIVLESKYRIELDKNKLFEKEIEELRKNLNQLKIKEISESEAFIKLENENYKSVIDFKTKENQLLKKENQTISIQIINLQNYCKEYFQIPVQLPNEQENHSNFIHENVVEVSNEIKESSHFENHEEGTQDIHEPQINSKDKEDGSFEFKKYQNQKLEHEQSPVVSEKKPKTIKSNSPKIPQNNKQLSDQNIFNDDSLKTEENAEDMFSFKPTLPVKPIQNKPNKIVGLNRNVQPPKNPKLNPKIDNKSFSMFTADLENEDAGNIFSNTDNTKGNSLFD